MTTASSRGRKPKDFVCTNCGEEGRAKATRAIKSDRPGAEYKRNYKCVCGHTFVTVETMLTPHLAHAIIRSGRGEHPFDPARLAERLKNAIPKILSDDEHAELLEAITARAAGELAQGRFGKQDEARPRIAAGQLTQVVLQALSSAARRPVAGDKRERLRAANVQFALAVLGQSNDLRPAFVDASDFMEWLAETHPGLLVPGPHMNSYLERPPELRWTPPPTTRPHQIATVVKNFRVDEEDSAPAQEAGPAATPSSDETRARAAGRVRRRRNQNFSPASLQSVVERSLSGRKRVTRAREDLPPRPTVPEICEWVQWGFVGQEVVRSSQLSSSVAEILRSVDDIAYLRWVAIGKELTVEQLMSEAAGLRDFPSSPIRVIREVHPGIRTPSHAQLWQPAPQPTDVAPGPNADTKPARNPQQSPTQ